MVIYVFWGLIIGRHMEHFKIRKCVPIRKRLVPNLCHNDKNILFLNFKSFLSPSE